MIKQIKQDKYRGTGRTTRQMECAPKNSVYVWNGELSYPKQLAQQIGREDLQIVGTHWLDNGWLGKTLTGLTIDHHAWETFGDEKRLCVQNAMLRVRHG